MLLVRAITNRLAPPKIFLLTLFLLMTKVYRIETLLGIFIVWKE